MKTIIAALIFSLVSSAAYAQSAVTSAAPQTEDIVKALTPRDVPRTKSLKGVSVTPATAPPSIDLTINFAFDSARLEPDGVDAVRRLGNALKDPRLSNFRFTIAGHTDAKGTDDYNQRLSEERANTVRDQLVNSYEVDASRLRAVGFGKTMLLNSGDPFSEQNRRVRVTNDGAAPG